MSLTRKQVSEITKVADRAKRDHKCEGIVKVQVSLFASDGRSMLMIYNEDRSLMQEFQSKKEFTEKLVKEIKKGGDPEGNKGYFYYHCGKDKFIVLEKLAPWQDW